MAKARKRTTKPPDWTAIEQAYVQGADEVTYAALARKHALSASVLRKRGAAGGWTAKRLAFRDQAGRQAQETCAKARGEHIAAQAAERIDAMHDAVLKLLERLEGTGGKELRFVAVAFGIVSDKLDQELERIAPGAGKLVETTYSRRELILGEIRQGELTDANA